MYEPEKGVLAFLQADPAILELIQDKLEPPRIFPDKVPERVSRLSTCIRYEVDHEEDSALWSGPIGMGVAEIVLECRASTLAKARELEQRIRRSRGGDPDGRKFNGFTGFLGAGYVAQKVQIKSAVAGEEKPTKATDASVYWMALAITLAWNTQTVSSTQSQIVSGLIAYYTLSDLNDSHTGARHLTNNGGVTFSAGKVGDAANLGGGGQSLSRTDSAFNVATFSIACWFRLTAPYVATKTLVSRRQEGGGDGNQGYSLAITAGEEPVIGVGDAITSVTLSWGAVIAAETWYSLIAWGSATEIGISLNNGTPVTTAGLAAGNGNVPFCLGATNLLFDQYVGAIDEVGVWDRVLTAAERTALYNGGAGRTWPLP